MNVYPNKLTQVHTGGKRVPDITLLPHVPFHNHSPPLPLISADLLNPVLLAMHLKMYTCSFY